MHRHAAVARAARRLAAVSIRERQRCVGEQQQPASSRNAVSWRGPNLREGERKRVALKRPKTDVVVAGMPFKVITGSKMVTSVEDTWEYHFI
jgi:hypothetical protein